jgi:hypothetical protein
MTGSDGIGDTPYTIDSNNIDHYPLMGSFSSLYSNAAQASVSCISNSTVSGFQINETTNTISFSVTGPSGTAGFCTLTITDSAMYPPYTVLIDGKPVSYTNIYDNGTVSVIYFAYQNSTHEVTVTQETGGGGGCPGRGIWFSCVCYCF